jgi:hypothetical protein
VAEVHHRHQRGDVAPPECPVVLRASAAEGPPAHAEQAPGPRRRHQRRQRRPRLACGPPPLGLHRGRLPAWRPFPRGRVLGGRIVRLLGRLLVPRHARTPWPRQGAPACRLAETLGDVGAGIRVRRGAGHRPPQADRVLTPAAATLRLRHARLGRPGRTDRRGRVRAERGRVGRVGGGAWGICRRPPSLPTTATAGDATPAGVS